MFELGIFSFNSYVYYLTCGFIASARAFNLPTCAFSLSTRAFNLATRVFSVLTRGCELVTRGFELATRGFELVTRNSELVFYFSTNRRSYDCFIHFKRNKLENGDTVIVFQRMDRE